MKNQNELHYMRKLAAEIVKTSEAWLCPMPERSGLGKYSIGAHLRQASSHEARSHRGAGELVCAAGPGDDSEDDDGQGFTGKVGHE